jgi:dihydropteroate synthase
MMGIVNVTPDSFSGDGVVDAQEAVAKALKQLSAGADIIDIGGESTRPGYAAVSVDEECRRVIPAIAGLRQKSAAVISVDTTKPEVLQQAIVAGADILNSVWGVSDELLGVLQLFQLPVVIMHNKEKPEYDGDVVDEVLFYLDAQARRAIACGIKPEQVILDPGIGFGKTAEHNLAVLRALDLLVGLGFPTLLGVSRKSFIGKLTGRPVSKREFGTASAIAIAIAAGVDIVRVHDVKMMSDAVKVADAMVRGWRPDDWQQS